SRHRAAAQGNRDHAGPSDADLAVICRRPAHRWASPTIGTRFSPAGFRVQAYGGSGQARGGRRRDPRATQNASTVAPVTDEQVERVRALVAAIPTGRVATYGDIASAAGLSSPRIVGWIMRTDSADLPWHRVITASGRPARHLATRQLELLRAEGVLAVDGRISLREFRYEFPTGT